MPLIKYVASKTPHDAEVLSLLFRKLYAKQVTNACVPPPSPAPSVASPPLARSNSIKRVPPPVPKDLQSVIPLEIARELSFLDHDEKNVSHVLTFYHESLLVPDQSSDMQQRSMNIHEQMNNMSSDENVFTMEEDTLSVSSIGSDIGTNNSWKRSKPPKPQFSPMSSFLVSVQLSKSASKNEGEHKYLHEKSVEWMNKNTPL